jgi:hypothetical protein
VTPRSRAALEEWPDEGFSLDIYTLGLQASDSLQEAAHDTMLRHRTAEKPITHVTLDTEALKGGDINSDDVIRGIAQQVTPFLAFSCLAYSD